jgi:hypothetical protein
MLGGAAAGAIGTSNYNLAISLDKPERQGVAAGLVSVVLALGSVVVNIAGGDVLKVPTCPASVPMVPPALPSRSRWRECSASWQQHLR